MNIPLISIIFAVTALALGCQPDSGPALTLFQTRTPTPAATVAPTSPPDPQAVLKEARLLMLDLINEARADAGVPPVELGYNRAAQIHAENLAEACASSHWGVDGTKPEHRYSLAGGYHVNAENVNGDTWCVGSSLSPVIAAQRSMETLMASEGHRAEILDSLHRQVNLGFALNPRGFLHVVQQFEGDYVEYDGLPAIKGEVLYLQGRLKNGATLHIPDDLDVQVWYAPPPMPATVGQLARTYCVDPGQQVTALEPLPLGRTEIRWKHQLKTHTFCKGPHDFPADTPPPASEAEAAEVWREAKARVSEEAIIEVPWVPASTWRAEGRDFEVVADLAEVLDEHGPGVYTVVVWAPVNGRQAVVSAYSIFHETEPLEGYGPR